MAVPAFAQGALLWEDTFVTDGSLRDRTSEGWWTGLPIWTGQAALQVVSGLVATGQADGTYADAFANGPGSGVTDINDLDVVLEDISVKPGTNRQIYLHARLIPQGVGTGGEANGSGATSYAANFTTLSGADRWRLSKQVNGAFTALGTGGQVNQEESAGFGMGLRVLGGTQELYRQASVGGGWTQLLTASDTAISPTSDDARWIGLECNGSAFRAGRIAVYSVADDSDVETSGTVTSVAEVRAASSQVFFSGSLAAAAVVSGVTTLPGILQTQGDVTSVAVVTGVSDTSAPVGDATSRAIVTGVSALVGEEEVGSNGLTVSTAVVSTAGGHRLDRARGLDVGPLVGQRHAGHHRHAGPRGLHGGDHRGLGSDREGRDARHGRLGLRGHRAHLSQPAPHHGRRRLDLGGHRRLGGRHRPDRISAGCPRAPGECRGRARGGGRLRPPERHALRRRPRGPRAAGRTPGLPRDRTGSLAGGAAAVTAPTYQLRGFGEDGVVTDTGVDRLKTSELSSAENMILPDGVPTERGGWTTLGVEDPINDGSFPYILGSVMAAVNLETGVTELVVTGTSETGGNWGFGKATAGDAGIAATTPNEGEYWAKAYYRGEALLASRSGLSPIRRWSFRKRSEAPVSSTGTGTYSVADGSNQLVGSGSNFDPELVNGLYVAGGFNRDSLHRVVSVTSDTKAGLAAKADWDVPSQNAVMLPFGVIGLKVLVTDIGLITHTSSGTAITGNGTKWRSAGRGYGEVEPGDWILRVGDNIANALKVTAVSSDTSITVVTNSVGAFTDAAYVILRPACGREVCEHDNALWVAGVPWAKGTAFTTPPGYDPAHVTNGRFGKTVQADEAMRMFEVPIPSPDSPGEILAMRSTRGAWPSARATRCGSSPASIPRSTSGAWPTSG